MKLSRLYDQEHKKKQHLKCQYPLLFMCMRRYINMNINFSLKDEKRRKDFYYYYFTWSLIFLKYSDMFYHSNSF